MSTSFGDDVTIAADLTTTGGSKGYTSKNGSSTTVARIGDSSAAGFLQLMDSSGAVKVYLRTDATSSYINNNAPFQLGYYSGGTASFLSDGTITNSSDVTLKDVKRPFTRGLADLVGIEPITYKWKKDSGLESEHEYTGFSSQNVRESIPEAVGETLSLSDRPIIAALINAVKELAARIIELEAKTAKA